MKEEKSKEASPSTIKGTSVSSQAILLEPKIIFLARGIAVGGNIKRNVEKIDELLCVYINSRGASGEKN
jgi:hypothetical protein